MFWPISPPKTKPAETEAAKQADQLLAECSGSITRSSPSDVERLVKALEAAEARGRATAKRDPYKIVPAEPKGCARAWETEA